MTICNECGSGDLWLLGELGGEYYIACRECEHRWKSHALIGPATANESGQGDLLESCADTRVGSHFTGAGDARRDDGIEAAARKHHALTWFAREIALHLGREGEIVCMDHVQSFLIRAGHQPTDLGNAAGATFRGKLWRCVGFRNSARDDRQSGVIREWQRADIDAGVPGEVAI